VGHKASATPTVTAGFSLIEVLVAAGVSSIFALVIAQMLTNQTEAERRLWQAMNETDLDQVVNGALSDKMGCGNTLIPIDGGTGLPVPVDVKTSAYDSTNNTTYTSIADIKDPKGMALVQRGEVFPLKTPGDSAVGGDLHIVDIQLMNPVDISIPNDGQRQMRVRIIYNKLSRTGAASIQVFKDFDIALYFTAVPAPGTLTYCWGIDTFTKAACESFNSYPGAPTGTGLFDGEVTGLCQQLLSPVICLGNTCRNNSWQIPTCPVAGQYIYGFAPNTGEPLCRN